MKISHRAPAVASAPAPQLTTAEVVASLATKAPRLSCCCRLSELLPLVRQVHDAARAAQRGGAEQPGVAA